MRMRLLIPLLLAPAMGAQGVFHGDAAEARMAFVKASQDGVEPVFYLLHAKTAELGDSYSDPAFVDATLGGCLRWEEFKAGEAEAWSSRLGWGPGAHWLLLAPSGEVIANGVQAPDAQVLLDAMRGTGWIPRSQQLETFIRENPEEGGARWERVYQDLEGLQMRLHAWNLGTKPGREPLNLPPEALLALDRLKEDLRRFMAIPGWQDHAHLMVIMTGLRVLPPSLLSNLDETLIGIRAGLESRLQNRPSASQLWFSWSWLPDPRGTANALALLDGLAPVPGAPWPPMRAVGPLMQAFMDREDWTGLDAFAEAAMTTSLAPEVVARQPDNYVARTTLSWAWPRLVALHHLGRMEDAKAVLKETRDATGADWPRIAKGFADSLARTFGKDDPLPLWLGSVTGEKSAPTAKAQLPPPLHLALLGHPAWEREWGRYPALSAFDAWEPGAELNWQPFDAHEEKALQAHGGKSAEPRWALMRGNECLAGGTSLPLPAFLADRMRMEGKPYLEQLDTFIRAHPDQLEARKARMEALRRRMPNERLEATLLEDARATLLPFHPGE
ncbi:MAG TPA: hypothetical protein VFF77_05115, partial [Holophagaceae bacterium]|nr:hypothetical protein [Holophagaceae bacterium]